LVYNSGHTDDLVLQPVLAIDGAWCLSEAKAMASSTPTLV